MFVNRLFAVACVLALGMLVPVIAEDKDKGKDEENPAAKKSDLSGNGRHKLFLKRNEESKGKGKVVFLGDSITEGWEGQKAWNEHFGEFEPVNLGISGDRTGGVLWRISDGKELEGISPKAAVIMIGTNNIGSHKPEQIAGGIKAIVEELKKQKPGIKILVLGVFPRGNGGEADKETKTIPAGKLNKAVGEINAIIAKLDDGKTVFYKDIGKEFLTKDGGLPGETMPDYLHLSGKGYDLWGKAIKADIAGMLNPSIKKLNRDIPRHKEFLKRIADSKGKGEVIFLGDSITHGWENNGKAAWKEYFGAFEPVNLGIGGDQTGHILWRIIEGKELADLKPKAAVIMIGTNNLSAGHTPEQIAGGIKAIIAELKAQKPGIKVLLLGVFPRSGKKIEKEAKMAKADELQPKIKQINDIIAKFDDGKTVFYKDIGKDFLDKEGNLPKDIMYDYLHLTAPGYEIWGKAIKADLEKLVK